MNYAICRVPLALEGAAPFVSSVRNVLDHLFSLVPSPEGSGGISIRIAPFDEMPADRAGGEVAFEAPGLRATRTVDGYRLESRGASVNVDPRFGDAQAWLSQAFLNAHPQDQRGFWVFALLLLLSARGLCGIHAAGIAWDGCGFLLAGRSGSGKTTVACALARSGWQYLSDDAVLLKRAGQNAEGVEAIAFGRLFHCTTSLVHRFPELGPVSQPSAYGKNLVDPTRIYPGQFLSCASPQAILFPEISFGPTTRLIPLNQSATLLRLIGEGAGLLHDRQYMATQMEILGILARSARGFRLLHGADIHTHPHQVSDLLRQYIPGDRTHAMPSAA